VRDFAQVLAAKRNSGTAWGMPARRHPGAPKSGQAGVSTEGHPSQSRILKRGYSTPVRRAAWPGVPTTPSPRSRAEAGGNHCRSAGWS
jgi:hypothetical protein